MQYLIDLDLGLGLTQYEWLDVIEEIENDGYKVKKTTKLTKTFLKKQEYFKYK